MLDAFHDRDVAVTVCRQEGGAAMMAEAVGKLTGKPGVAFVTRGPGATNASPGIHIAQQDSTPMILFVGQIGREMREREAFQELDYRAVFGTMTKWATEIDDPARIPEIVSRAFYTATSGRPGPVVIALPEDMLTERVAVDDVPAAEQVETWPGLSEMARLQKLIWAAERPIMLLGGSRWSAPACASVMRFAERFAMPVVTTFRRAHLFDQLHPSYAGDLGVGPNPKVVARIKAADLVIMVGGRMGEMPSQGYTLFDIPVPKTTFVHVHPGAEELGRVYRPSLAIHAAPTAFAAALEGLQPPNEIRWRDETRRRARRLPRLDREADRGAGRGQFRRVRHVAAQAAAARTRSSATAPATIRHWTHRFYRFRQFGTQLGPTSGSMGYGVPAAVAAKRLYPERTVVAFAGDGCFLMNGQEFATAVQYDLPIIVVVVDNGMYGTIRMHQERDYPGRAFGDDAEESRLRRLCPRLRRLRRHGREDRRLRGGVRGGAEVRQARDRAREGRSRRRSRRRRRSARSARRRWRSAE